MTRFTQYLEPTGFLASFLLSFPVMKTKIPDSVIQAFGAMGKPEPLQGGQGNTFRVGNIVIKPCDDAQEMEGLSALMDAVVESGFRRARPLKAVSGNWVVDNWQAFAFVEGNPGKRGIAGREEEALSGCYALHEAIKKAYSQNTCPPWLCHRRDFWQCCNLIAWGEQELTGNLPPEAIPEIQPLWQQLEAVSDLESQIVHGDPGGGNVLFHDSLPPAMIDIAPYWRPLGYSIAMLLADAVAWEGSRPEVLELGKQEKHFRQLLLRAVLFRLVIPALKGDVPGILSRKKGYLPILHYIGIDR